ncbi:UvrD-helicase domain-containing protein [Micromonospora sp. NPDC047527]|uniref:UvrD-helicase domain-containing protein n=1 Tax=Micromonospora sp. NPDC047527 TaxID=3155144 RepID=UPI0033D9A7CE
MSFRIQRPDTAADLLLRKILNDNEATGFTMIAGAGSGKTTSLVKAIAHVVDIRGKELLANGQQVACITYTEVATREVEDDLAGNQAVHVSTIHSFLWRIVSHFQQDIRRWVEEQVEIRLAKATAEQAGFSKRVRQPRRDATFSRIRRLTEAKSSLNRVSRFTYGVASDFRKGTLGHEDITTMVPTLIIARPLLAKVVARRYPVILVDESQDTLPNVVDCLRHIAQQQSQRFCLGFFGDPMQKIYVRGVGDIPLSDQWLKIEKPENFRSPTKVLQVINAIREDGDGLRQVSGLPEVLQVEGEVTFFVLPRDRNRKETITGVRAWLAQQSAIGAWIDGSERDSTKILVVAHRMAARRLGFEALYEVFHGSRLQDAFDEGRAWPIAPFLGTLMPLYQAARHSRSELVPILRRSSPLLQAGDLVGGEVRARLRELSRGVDELVRVIDTGGAGSVGRALRVAEKYKLVSLEPRLSRFLLPASESEESEAPDELTDVVPAFLETNISELAGYFAYIDRESPYSTHQGVKGAEYPDVLVILDDEEGRHNQFSYDKLFGVKGLSQTDRNHQVEGKETIIDRTRRLLYVCASRATRALAIVFYADDVDVAFEAISKSGLPGTESTKRLVDILA